MRNIIVALVLLFITSTTMGQDYGKGTINYLNGDTKTGLIKLTTDFVKFKINSDAETLKINSSLIKNVVFESIEGNKFIIEHTYMQLRKSNIYRYGWLQLLQKGYFYLYLSGDGYSFDKKGNLILTSSYVMNRTLPSFIYYVKKFDEDKTMYFCETNGLGTEHFSRKSCQKYLSDYSELVEKVMKKEFTKFNTEYVISQYNQFKAKKGQ